MILAITPGDPDGIGPEVVVKGLLARPLTTAFPLVFGSAPAIERYTAAFAKDFKLVVLPESLLQESERAALLEKLKTIQSQKNTVAIIPTPAGQPGFQSGWAIEKATRFVLSEPNSAIVTGPVDKKRLNEGGYKHPGHTEFLAELCQADSVTMMLANSKLRVSLVTIHAPLAKVPTLLTSTEIERAVTQTAEFLIRDCGIEAPHIAVMGLNPHAGEKGLLGKEEDAIISPTLAALTTAFKTSGSLVELSGPHPADTYFALHAMGEKKADAVIAMYHDQGLIPVKLIDFKNTVNLTLGLPIIRTSVDHGTAFELSGRNLADSSSFTAALLLAETLVQNRLTGGPNNRRIAS